MEERWIIPSNTKYFDVVSYLEKNNEIVFRRISALREGDIVYIYVTAPYSEIKYRGHVICDQVSDDEMKSNEYAIPTKSYDLRKNRYIKIEIDYRYPEGTFCLNELKQHGLGQMQMQARTDRKVQQYIDEIEKKLGIR